MIERRYPMHGHLAIVAAVVEQARMDLATQEPCVCTRPAASCGRRYLERLNDLGTVDPTELALYVLARDRR